VQVAVEGVGNAKEGVDPGRTPAAFEPRDRGLRRADEIGELGLGEAPLLPSLSHLAGDLGEEPALLGAGKTGAQSLQRLTHISTMLYIAVMRYRQSIAVVSYVGAGCVWIFWFLDRQPLFAAGWFAIAFLIAVHIAVAFAVARWWAVTLPFLWVGLAYPLGYPSANLGEPGVIWQLLLGWTPVAALLLGFGVARRSLGPWRGGLGVR
jgi:hypothetical protein